jgi:hypothetical protein
MNFLTLLGLIFLAIAWAIAENFPFVAGLLVASAAWLQLFVDWSPLEDEDE